MPVSPKKSPLIASFTSLLTITAGIGLGITLNPEHSWAGSCVGVYSSRSGVPSASQSQIGYYNPISKSYVTIATYNGGGNINAAATQPSTGNLFFVNRLTGKTVVYNVNTGTQTPLTGTLPGDTTTIIGATFAPTGKLYVYYSSKTLIEVDPATGTQVGVAIAISGIPGTGSSAATNGDIAIGTDGVLYAIGDTSVNAFTGAFTSQLYSIAVTGTTAVATPVNGNNPITGVAGAAVNGLAVDPVTSKFYISTNNGSYELDFATKAGTLLTTAVGTNDLAACGSPTPDLPTIVKQFTPDTVTGTPAVSTLQFTLGNTNSVPIYLIKTLTDTFQPGMTINSPNGLTGTCNTIPGNTITAVAGTNSISLVDGLKIPAGGCTVSVNVKASVPGVFTNTIAAGALKTIAGDNAAPTTDTFTVIGLGIAGTVFEDPNYGGGTGRDFSTPTTVGRDGATVELYKSDGTYITNTITSGGGKYEFTGIAAGDYRVRVVNSTVTSSRPGAVAGLLPVQTFRTDATTGTVTDVTDHVGGEKPKEIDAPANTTANLSTLDTATQEVQSITTVKVGTTAVTGIDFGYNFDTIVNTNNTGQGSLRQFITNSNTLTNAGLAQVGQTAGKEVSIFMIPDGAAHSGLRAGMASGINGTGGNANAAVISLASNFSITDANTQLDATTQTTNVGDLNPGTVGTGGTVGVDGLPLSTVPKPEVVLDLRLVPTNTNAILVKGGNTVLKGFASYGYRTTGNLSTLLKAAIVVDAVVPDASRATITQLLGGTMADGSDPAVPTIDVGYTLQTAGAANISNNYLAYNSDAITFENTNGTSVNFIDNELAYNGPKNNNGSNASGIYADQMETVQGTKNITLRGNLVRNSTKPGYANSQGQGIQISYSSLITLENNTFTDNNVYAINASASDTLIRKNIIAGTKNTGLGQGSGIVVYYGGPLNTGLRNHITQNSIYQNAKLGIDHQADGVTPNDGAVSATQPNNGIDYPIVTSSLLSGNDLVVKGYVGNVPAGSTKFANVTLEFFIADDDGNNNGKVFSTDPATVSKPHGEGKTYIGTCMTNGSSLFDCTFANVNNLMPTGQTFDPKNITATATDAVGNTSEFSSTPMANNPNVLLVKRITAINGSTSTFGGDSLAGYIDELTNAYDDNTVTIPTQLNPTDPPKDTDKWPTLSSFMLGGINGGNIKPNDEVEYSIYFLSAGLGEAKNVLFCDRVPSNVSFIPTAFNSATPAAGGLAGDRGILSLLNGTTTAFTNIADGDAARYFAPGSDPTSIYPNINCGGTNDNGAIVVNLGNLPNATAPGTPAGAFGFVRFKGRVK